MGNPKQKWTAEEEDALIAGIAKHGAGKWTNIQRDPEFNHLLYSRSNIDLKDKWRNMSIANSQAPREKSRTSKPKDNPDAPPTPVANDAPTDAVMEESPECIFDWKAASTYNVMIYEALSTMNDPNGSDVSSLVNFIEKRREVPPNFRKVLTGKLTRLAGQGRLEKALNGYRITGDILTGVKAPAQEQKDIVCHPWLPLMSGNYLSETLEDAAVAAAYRVSQAENKSFVAAEAMKEAERVAGMAEDADLFLQLAKEMFERCKCQKDYILVLQVCKFCLSKTVNVGSMILPLLATLLHTVLCESGVFWSVGILDHTLSQAMCRVVQKVGVSNLSMAVRDVNLPAQLLIVGL